MNRGAPIGRLFFGRNVQLIKAILFDLDGTLVNTGSLITKSFRYTLKTVLGIEATDEELVAAVGTPLLEQMERIARSHVVDQHDRPVVALADRSVLNPVEQHHITRVDEVRNELMDVYTARCAAIHDEEIAPYEGVEEMLQELVRAGFPMGVVTSKRRRQAEPDLAHFGLDKYFELLLCADDYPYHKPDPRPLLHAMSQLGELCAVELAVQECAYIGDSPYDVLASKAAGMKTLAVSWGLFTEAQLIAEQPDVMVHHPREIGESLKQ